MKSTRCAVLGAGSWGTAFALVLADAGHDVHLWSRRADLAEKIRRQRCNPEYLPDVELPSTIIPTSDPAAALADVELVVFAVPAQSLRKNLVRWRAFLPPQVIAVSLMKGIELGTNQRMSEVITEVTAIPRGHVTVLSGPNLASEIARRQPAASVISGGDSNVTKHVAHLCATPAFRPYTGSDVIGTELAGAVKNVIALAVGMSAGLGFGDNTKAAIITRGLAETARLGAALGADLRTFSGLAGVGDLMATCMSPLSRNRTFGERLARGESVAEIAAATRQVAEGVKSCRSIVQLARAHQVDMPIAEGVVAVVHDGVSPAELGQHLLARARKAEGD
ncbi:MAG: NAD(P)H-dependent glycerol-3-phosphate dehydrogenase [Actinomycetota bacterium]